MIVVLESILGFMGRPAGYRFTIVRGRSRPDVGRSRSSVMDGGDQPRVSGLILRMEKVRWLGLRFG